MLKFLSKLLPDCQAKPGWVAALVLLFLLGAGPQSRAQLNNRAFLRPIVIKPEYDQQLWLDVNALLFNKDNEYFNKIDEGRTYYGTQLAPRLVYFASPKLRLEAGIFLQKDYGTNKLRQVRPLLTIIYQNGPHRLLVGNIQGNLHHGYIEPLFDFERLFFRPLEEGTQYQLTTRRLKLDAWVDWQRQQYRYSNFQEEVAGGLTAEATVLEDSAGWRLGVPFQFTGTHHGGQIDTIDQPLETIFDLAGGLRVRKKLPSELVHAVYAEGYVTRFIDYSFTKALPFTKGTGFYFNAGLNTRLSDVQLGYWHGTGFYSPLGGRLYRSISSSVADPSYTERRRELLILRVVRDYQLSDNLVLTTRFEPLYDFGNKAVDFSFALYLNFNQSFLLTTLKRNKPQ